MERLMDDNLIRIFGANWCGDCFRAKMIFDHHQINYQWIDIDRDKIARDFVSQVNNGEIVIPTIVFQDGTILIEPSNQILRTKLGLEDNEF
jgi:mycoredoxin